MSWGAPKCHGTSVMVLMSGKPRMREYCPSGVLCLVALALLIFVFSFAHAAPTDRIIVRFKAGADSHPVRKDVDAQLETEFGKLANRPLRLHRATGGRGEFVLKLEKRLPNAEVDAMKSRATLKGISSSTFRTSAGKSTLALASA